MTHPSEAPSTRTDANQEVISPESQSAEAAAESERILSLKATDSKTLFNEIRRLERENEDFRGVFTNEVGRRAERQYKPELARRDAEIAELKIQLRRNEFEKMSEEDINKRFQTDPAFAKEYAEVSHYKPQAPSPLDETPLITEAFENLQQWAQDEGLPEAAWAQYINQVQSGKYGDLSRPWREIISEVQRDIATALIKMHKTPPSPEEPTKPAFNASLTKGGPDTSTSTRGTSRSLNIPKTATAFNDLPLAQQQAILRSPGGMEAVAKLQG